MLLGTIVDTALDRTLIGYSKVGYAVRGHAWDADDPPADALAGRVAIVTGARAGLGKATVAGLARLGATVHMVVRKRGPGEEAREDILEEVPGAEILVEECDVSSLDSVRAYAKQVNERGPLHVLIHNAGVMPERREVTDDGNEMTFATHALGPHLLTSELRPALKAGAPSRVIWVSSGGMYSQRLPADDLQYENGEYSGTTAYARTKRMQVVLAHEWADRLRGDGIVVHSTHPGWAGTGGVAESLPTFNKVMGPLLRNAEQGADTTVWVAAAAEPGRISGRFWHDRQQRPVHYLGLKRETAAERDALWAACERLTGAGAGSA